MLVGFGVYDRCDAGGGPARLDCLQVWERWVPVLQRTCRSELRNRWRGRWRVVGINVYKRGSCGERESDLIFRRASVGCGVGGTGMESESPGVLHVSLSHVSGIRLTGWIDLARYSRVGIIPLAVTDSFKPFSLHLIRPWANPLL